MANFKMAGGGCCCCPEVMLLTDTTGSMGTFITTVQAVFNTLSQRIKDHVCKWSVCDYKDITDGSDYASPGIKIDRKFTDDFSLVTSAIAGYTAFGGGDTPEEQFLALKYAADNWANATIFGGKSGGDRVLIWAGDAEAHAGGAYPTLSDVITALTNAKIKVFAINPASARNGLDTSGDAAAICAATKGQLFNNVDFASSTAVATAIETAIG